MCGSETKVGIALINIHDKGAAVLKKKTQQTAKTAYSLPEFSSLQIRQNFRSGKQESIYDSLSRCLQGCSTGKQ